MRYICILIDYKVHKTFRGEGYACNKVFFVVLQPQQVIFILINIPHPLNELSIFNIIIKYKVYSIASKIQLSQSKKLQILILLLSMN